MRAGVGRLGRIEPAVAVLVTAVATLSFADFYVGWLWLPVVAGAVVLGGLVAGAAVAWRWPWWVGVPVAMFVLALWLVETAYPALTFFGAPTLQTLSALAGGVVTGLPKMLTVGLPADLAGDLLVPPAILGYAAGAGVVLICTRTTSVTAAAVPPLLVYVVGVVLTASRPQPRLLVTGVVVLAVLVLLLLRSNRLAAADREGIDAADADAVGVDLASRRWHSTMARVGFGLPAVVLATVLAVVAAWFLPIADGSDRIDPRTLRDQPFRLTETLSPLGQVRPQLGPPRIELFTVTVTNESGGGFRPDRVRIAALDQFDGALWTGTRDFQISGSSLPDAEDLEEPVQRIRLDVDVKRLLQPFVPVVGEPLLLSGEGFAFDRATATAVRTTPVTEPFRYQTVGELRAQDAETRQAERTVDPAYAPLTVLDNPPPWVAELADQIVQDRQTPMSQLLAIESYLRSQPYSPEALPGHSYGALKRVLFGGTDRAGNAEQYAAAFAVLARAKGYPARVAVGYQLRPEQRDGDTYTVYSTDIHAWPEVHLEGQGWVAFEPTDARSPVVPPPPRGPEVTLAAADGDVPVVAPQRAGENATPAQVAARVGIGLGVLAGVVVLVCLLVALAKAMRRGRRARRGPPAQRVVAAWAEVVDRLQEAGLRVPVSRTASEVAADARRNPAAFSAAASIDALAPLVTDAVYGPDEPTAAHAQRAWELERTIRRQVVRSLGLWQRLRGLVDPRPLFPRLRRRRADRAAAAPPPAAATAKTVAPGRPR